MKKVFFMTSVLLSVFVLFACGSASKADSSVFVGKTVVAESLYGEPVCNDSLMSPAELMFMVEDNRLAGSAGCNNIMGSYTITEDKISFGGVGMTRRMCDPVSMDVEYKLTKLLGEVNRFETEDNKVRFFNGDTELGVFAVKCCKKQCCSADKTKCVKDSAACCKKAEHKCCKDSAACKSAEKKCCAEKKQCASAKPCCKK